MKPVLLKGLEHERWGLDSPQMTWTWEVKSVWGELHQVAWCIPEVYTVLPPLRRLKDVYYTFVSVFCYHATPEKCIWKTNRDICSIKQGDGQDSGVADLSYVTFTVWDLHSWVQPEVSLQQQKYWAALQYLFHGMVSQNQEDYPSLEINGVALSMATHLRCPTKSHSLHLWACDQSLSVMMIKCCCVS